MNASERQVADTLDELHVEWVYEPTMLVLKQDADGHPKEGFQPDFWLPKYQMFFEVTLAKSVTAKNRKIRLAKEIHDVDVILISKDDFHKDLKAKLLRVLRTRRSELQTAS